MFQELLQSRAIRLLFLVAVVMWLFESDPGWVEKTKTGERMEWEGDPARAEGGSPVTSATEQGVHSDGPVAQCTGFDRHTFADAGLDGLEPADATEVAADLDGGLWVLADTTVVHINERRIDRTQDLPGSAYRMAVGPSGEVAVAVGDAVTLLGPGLDTEYTFQLSLPDGVFVGGVAIAEDGTVLMGDTGEGRITALQPDGGVRPVLDAAGGEADAGAQVDEPLGPIDSLVALPDGRIAFLMWRDAGVGLVDGGEVHRVQPTPTDDSRSLLTLDRTPGGQLLAIASGPETHPQILTIDVETGATDIVADLPRNGTGPLSATAVGDDVVYLADHQLCRLTGVLD